MLGGSLLKKMHRPNGIHVLAGSELHPGPIKFCPMPGVGAMNFTSSNTYA